MLNSVLFLGIVAGSLVAPNKSAKYDILSSPLAPKDSCTRLRTRTFIATKNDTNEGHTSIQVQGADTDNKDKPTKLLQLTREAFLCSKLVDVIMSVYQTNDNDTIQSFS
jgi:hypothetical protein